MIDNPWYLAFYFKNSPEEVVVHIKPRVKKEIREYMQNLFYLHLWRILPLMRIILLML